ncbi:hypothetical protein D3C78_1454760 [compost metagenome]
MHRQILGRLPAQRRVDGELGDHRQVVAGALVLVLDHIGGVVAPGDGLADRHVQRAFQALDYRFRHVFPLVHGCAGAAGADTAITRFDFIVVIVAEISHAGQPAFIVEFQPDFFIDAGFCLQVVVTQQVAAIFDIAGRTTLTFAVQQIVLVGLVQVRRFVGAGDAHFQGEVVAQFL